MSNASKRARTRSIGSRFKGRVIEGPFAGKLALFAGMRPHERVLVLLQLLGGERPVELAQGAIEVI